MKKLDHDWDQISGRSDDGEDEIEIIEVVGLDEDGAELVEDPIDEPTEVEEIVLDLDAEDGVPLEEAVAAAHAAISRPDKVTASQDREQLLRLQADFDNFKKRIEREREAFEKRATAAMISRLLPVLDNFERALSVEVDDHTFRDGVTLIFRQILEELRKEGLAAIDAVGQPFDPKLHEAVATDSNTELPSHMVVEEMQRGYLLHGRLLRPSLVKVSVDPPEPFGPGNGNGDS